MAQVQGNAAPKFLTVQQAGEELIFLFGNGKTITVHPAELPESIQQQAMFHGFNQKIRDSAAGFSKGEQYAEAYAEMADVVQSLAAGEWNRRGGGVGTKMEDLAQAIAKIKKAEIDAVRAAVVKASPEQRAEWAKNPKVAAAIAEVQQARLKAAAKDADDIEIEL